MLVTQLLMSLSLITVSDAPWKVWISQESQAPVLMDLPLLKTALGDQSDLHEKWKVFLLRELMQQRMAQVCANQMEKEEIRDSLYTQIDLIRVHGFAQEELNDVKARWINRLVALEDASPEISSSLAILYSLEMQDLLPCIDLLLQKQPSSIEILNVDEPVTPELCQLSSSAEHATPPEKTQPSSAVDAFYELPLSEHEKKLINELIRNMSERSIWGLLFKKREMERLGKRVNHVHPMRFISFILADPRLKHYLKDVSTSSFKWDHFIDGLSKRLKEEASHDNLTPYIAGMAHQLKFDPKRLAAFIHDKDYEGMVKAILNQR
jgi:hypothetical protein